MNNIRIYHQPFERPDSLMEVEVWIADEEFNFQLHGIFPVEIGYTEQGRFTDIDMKGVVTQAIRLLPRYRGWGHQLGEWSFGFTVTEILVLKSMALVEDRPISIAVLFPIQGDLLGLRRQRNSRLGIG